MRLKRCGVWMMAFCLCTMMLIPSCGTFSGAEPERAQNTAGEERNKPSDQEKVSREEQNESSDQEKVSGEEQNKSSDRENMSGEEESETFMQENMSGKEVNGTFGQEGTQKEEESGMLASVMATDQTAEINALAAYSIVDVAGWDTASVHALFFAQEISDEVYARINGCSYQQTGRIKLEELRYLRVLHMGIDGETHVGELIVNRAVSEDILEIMEALYEAEYPIEKMVLVDDYDGDDERSMDDNNTSAFNYRTIAGTNTLSNHSYGAAIDINPLYNPYVKVKSDGSVSVSPKGGGQYADREADFPYKIERGDLCYRLFTEHGFEWGGDWNSVKDYQHFEKSIV